jgi:tripeptidyl-peptidase-2
MEITSFPTEGILPKHDTQSIQFIEEFPQFDGRGVIVAVLDTGVDIGVQGLMTTSEGKPTIIDVYDASGSGDIPMSEVIALDGHLLSLTKRKLNVEGLENPKNKFFLGVVCAYDFYPVACMNRVKKLRKDRFDIAQRTAVNKLQKEIHEWTATNPTTKSDLEAQLEQLKAMSYEDTGPVFDIVMWKDIDNSYRVIVNTIENNVDLVACKILRDFRINQDIGSFGEEAHCNFGVKIFGDQVCSIVVGAEHGTHVAGIIAGYYAEQPELNGVAPGAQIVSIKIGDSRLGTMETGASLVRGLIYAKNAGADIINFSYGEQVKASNIGRFTQLVTEFTKKHNLIFVASAGNGGPGLTTSGAPGTTTDGVIGVGASITPPMMSVGYSLRELTPHNQYTFSARGPTRDGYQGVTITAPGGAFSSSPTFTLKKKTLMNGTSMSAPNCTGCISLILSGLKAKGIKHSPAAVKIALQNTAKRFHELDSLMQGNGMVQVISCFDYLCQHKNDLIGYSVDILGNRGIYLRDLYQIVPKEFCVNVKAQIEDEEENQVKLSFEKRMKLISTADWISCPENFILLSDQRSFNVFVDPSKLEPGKYHFGEVLAFDSASGAGPLFRVPVTITNPISLVVNKLTQKYEDFSCRDLVFKPAEVKRFFLNVPLGASWVSVKITQEGINPKRNFFLQAIQIIPHQSLDHTGQSKHFPLGGVENSSHTMTMKVTPERTIEVALAQWWSSIGIAGTVNVDISFHGFSFDTHGAPFELSTQYLKVDCRAHIGIEKIKPQANLLCLLKQFPPTSSVMSPLCQVFLERDLLPGGRQIYRVINTYKYQAEGSILTRVAALNQLLYDNPIESFLTMTFDENKKLINTSDYQPKQFSLPKKGKYTTMIQFRHDNVGLLQQFKTMNLIVEKYYGKDKQINLSIYPTEQSAITNGGKVSSISKSVEKNLSNILVITPPESSKIPKDAQAGDILLGSLIVKSTKSLPEGPDALNPIGGVTISYTIPSLEKLKETVSTPYRGKEEFFEYKRQQVVSFIDKIVATPQPFNPEILELIDSSLSEYPGYLPLLKSKLTYQTNLENKDHVEIIKTATIIIKLIDANALASHFGTLFVESSKEHKDFVFQKELFIFGYLHKLTALVNLNTDQTDKELMSEITEVRKELSKWVKIEEDEKFLPVFIELEIAAKKYYSALKVLKKAISANYKRELVDQEIAVLTELGWTHWVENKKERGLVDFPTSYRIF